MSQGQYFPIHSQGSVLNITISVDHIIHIIPEASEYQEIHPYSAVNIDSVEIKISLIMMREGLIFKQVAHEFMSKI